MNPPADLHKPFHLDPLRTALVCIDLQEEHRADDRYLVEGFADILANVMRLQKEARSRGIPVVHCAYVVGAPGSLTRPLHPTMPDGRSAFSNAGDPLVEICPEVAPAIGESASIKSDASAFSHPEFESDLRKRGVEWLIIVGVWTEACVAASVKDAVDRGFRVILVKDACGSGSQAMHQAATLNLANRLYGGAVVDASQACKLMGGTTVDAWQVVGSVPLRYTFETAAALYRSL